MAPAARLSKINIEIYDQQIERFRKRSDGLRVQAWVALFLIMMLLLSAVLIFFFASEIAKQDVSTEGEKLLADDLVKEKLIEAELVTLYEARDYETLHDDLLSDLVALRKNLEKSVSAKVVFYANSLKVRSDDNNRNNRQARIFNIEKEFKKESPTYLLVPRPFKSFVESALPSPVERAEVFNPVPLGIVEDDILVGLISDNDLFSEVQKIYSDGSKVSGHIQELLDQAQDEYGKIVDSKGRSADIQKKLTELREKNKKAANGGDITSSMTLLIQTNINRFGPMLVIFFFVTILVNLYRYSIRLSAYYEARADALFVLQSGIDSEKFDALVGALTPDNHDVGKAPKVPTDYVVDLAKTAVSKIPSGK